MPLQFPRAVASSAENALSADWNETSSVQPVCKEVRIRQNKSRHHKLKIYRCLVFLIPREVMLHYTHILKRFYILRLENSKEFMNEHSK